MHAHARILEIPRVSDANPPSQIADAELLRLYVETGDAGLMGEFFTRHAASAYRIALCVLRNSSDAEDAVQTSFMNALRSRTPFQKTDDESVKAWLFKNVVNACRMRMREETARRRREEAVGSDRATATEVAATNDLAERAVDAARQLGEIYRLPVWMHYLEGLSFKEVAAALAVPEATVKSRANRGIEQLRQVLAPSVGTTQKLTEASLIAVLAAAPLESAPLSLTAAFTHSAAAAAKTAGAAAKAGGTTAKSGLAFNLTAVAVVAILVAGGIFIATKVLKPAAPVAGLNDSDKHAAETGEDKSPQTVATQEPPKITGWRGDGTGKYPDATAPLQWSVRGKNLVNDLRCSSKKPKGDADPSGLAIPDGQIREWLVAGPFPFANPGKVAEPGLPGEAELQPEEGDKAGNATWKATTDGWTGDFGKLFGKNPNQVAYACSYVFSKTGGACQTWVRHNHCMQVWVNGKEVYNNAEGFVYKLTGNFAPEMPFTLNKGWNRLLFKVTYAEDERWAFSGRIFARRSFTYEGNNIAWIQRLPNTSSSSPLVVGDKVYVTSDPTDLICCNKADGKVRWIRSNTQFDALTPEEIEATPELKQKIAPLAAKLNQINDELVPLLNTSDPQLGTKLNQKNDLEQELVKQLQAIDGKRFSLIRQDGGFSVATPCSDGRNVYAWMYNGVCSCFDGEGKRKWCQRINEPESSDHGYASSPTLVNGKLIVMMADLTAFDAQTGKVLWKQKLKRGNAPTYGSIVAVPLGNDAALLSSIGFAVRASDGRPLWDFTLKFAGQCTTSVVEKGVWYNYDQAGVHCIQLPDNVGDNSTASILKYVKCGEYIISSPLFLDGLLYGVEFNGKLTVVDTEAGTVVYTQQLPLLSGGIYGNCAIYSSPTLIGKHIFVFDVFGNTVVFEPGRAYKQVAFNKLEMLDYPSSGDTQVRQAALTRGNPAVDKNCIYVRGNTQLICIAAGAPPLTVTLPDVPDFKK